ncbi:MAG: TonB-dependent receptor [Gammaproteobacteria bacterium]
MFRNTQRTNAVNTFYLAGALMVSSLALPTLAEDAEMEEVVVTGSRIARPDLIGNSPINVINAEDIKWSGVINTEQLLNEMPQLAPDQTSSTNNGGSGIATVDLRGLGANRTLTLVNGRRFIPADNEAQVDINNIPAPLIKRIDIVTGGASAVYGSDAIAGAINFILKDDFEGVEFGANFNRTEQRDADVSSFYLTMGGNFADDRGNAVIHLDFTERDALLARERGFSRTALTDIGIGTFFEVGSSRIPGGNILQSDLIFPDGTIATDAKFLPDGTPIPREGETFDFQPDNFLQTPLERLAVNFLGHYDINDDLEVYVEATYVNNQVDTQLAFDANDIPDVGPLFVPLSNPLVNNNAALATFLTTNFDQGTNGDATAGDGIATLSDFRRRMIEVGPRFASREFDAGRILVGLRGDLPIESWTFDAYYSEAQSNVVENLTAFTSDIRLQAALNATTDSNGNPVCIDPTGGCVPISLFGLGALPADAKRFVSPAASVSRETEQTIVSASATGDIFELPAGPVALAVGYEYREEKAFSRPDAIIQSGELGPGNDEFPVIGEFDVTEFYAEALIPLVADAPLAQSIELELAFRASDYSTVGTVGAFKVGGSWAVNDSLRFRSMFQRAVRAPNIFELFEGRSAGSESATDLCTASQIAVQATERGRTEAEIMNFCQALGVPNPGVFVADAQILTVQQGNPDLIEEEADTVTFGFVVSPTFLPGLNFSIDYYDIEVEDAINDLDADTVQGLCFESFDVSSQFCGAFDRNAVNGSIQELRSLRVNLASEDRTGIDWQIDYGFDALGGEFDYRMIGNFTIDNESVPLPGAATIDCNGIFGGDCTGLGNFAQPEWRLTSHLDYRRDKWAIRAQLRVIGELENSVKDTTTEDLIVPETDVVYYLDLTGRIDITENLNLVVGIENVTDQDPEVLGFDFAGLGGGADHNTDPSLYDTLGRRYFINATYHF